MVRLLLTRPLSSRRVEWSRIDTARVDACPAGRLAPVHPVRAAHCCQRASARSAAANAE